MHPRLWCTEAPHTTLYVGPHKAAVACEAGIVVASSSIGLQCEVVSYDGWKELIAPAAGTIQAWQAGRVVSPLTPV